MSTVDKSDLKPTGKNAETIDDVKEEVSQVSNESVDTAKEVANTRFEQGREATTDQLDSASEAMNEAAAKLEENDSPFASYAAELSGQLSSFSDKLSTSSIDDLVGGARTLARDNPAAFMLGSMAIGLAASRFFKATGEQVYRQNQSSAQSRHTGDESRGSNQHHQYKPGQTQAPDRDIEPHLAGTASGTVPGTVPAGSVYPPTGGTGVEKPYQKGAATHDTATGIRNRATSEEV